MNLSTVEIKAFVPARDFAVSKDFYRTLGFEVPWSGEDLAYVRHGSTSFLLQKFFVPAHAKNFVMHLLVEDVDAWYAHVMRSGVLEKYGIRTEPPADRPWNMRDFSMTDPTGVLWRIGQNIPTTERSG